MTDIDFSDLATDIESQPVRSSTKMPFPCMRCSGTGIATWGYVNIYSGPCKVCKGKGGFQTSPEHRTKAKVQRGERKMKSQLENWESFKAYNQAEAAWLESNFMNNEFARSLYEAVGKYGDLTEGQRNAVLRNLAKESAPKQELDADVLAWLQASAPAGNNFAKSLLDQYNSRGSLSEKQIAAVQRNLDRYTNQSAAPAADNGINLVNVAAAFSHATGAGLKAPRIRLPGLTFSIAGANSKNSGMIYAKSDDGVYLGKATRDGKFFPSSECNEEYKQLLRDIDQDVMAAAKLYGQETGNCSCCGRLLTDPVSVANGIGPICAGKFGF